MKTFLNDIRAAVLSTIILAVVCCGIYPAFVWAVSQAVFREKANGSLIVDASGTVRGSRLLAQGFSSDKYFIPRTSAAGAGYDATSSGGSNLGPTSKKLVNGTVKGTALSATQPGGPLQAGPEVVDFDGLKLRILGYCEQNGIPFQLLLDGKPVDLKTFQNKGEDDQVKLIHAFNADSTPDARPLTIAPATAIPADAVTASASGLDPHISLRNAELQAPRVAKTRGLSLGIVKNLIIANTDKPDLGFLGEAGVNVLALNLALDSRK